MCTKNTIEVRYVYEFSDKYEEPGFVLLDRTIPDLVTSEIKVKKYNNFLEPFSIKLDPKISKIFSTKFSPNSPPLVPK